jgi:hypothetical protein
MISKLDTLADVHSQPVAEGGPEQLGDILAQWWLQHGTRRVPADETPPAQRAVRPRVVTSACA